MKYGRNWCAAILAVAILALQLVPANACAFDTQVYFTYSSHPDLPLNKYAAGELGILNSGYARSYLLTAYKYLSNGALTSAEQASVVNLWNRRLAATNGTLPVDTAGWLKARSAVPGAKNIDSIDTDRSINPDEGWQQYCNCQSSAFDTATITLNNLIKKHGVASAAVKDWLMAQDQVFSNCGAPSYSDKPIPVSIPQPLPSNASLELQKDRAYQIAAANFYAQNFDAAIKEFEAIAADASSPRKKISGYLAVRSMIRKASLAKQLDKHLLAEAQSRLAKLSENEEYGDMAGDLAALNSYIAARLSPEEHLQDLLKQDFTGDTVGEITKTIDNLVEKPDVEKVADYKDLPISVKTPDEIDWVMSFKASDDASTRHVIDRWKQTHSLPWLVAAMTAVRADDAAAIPILAAAEQIYSGPAHWTLFYNANRLNLALGKKAAVRIALDAVLDHPQSDLPLGSLNELKTQRLRLARNLDELVHYGIQIPVAICSNGGTTEVPDEIEDIINSGKNPPQKPLITPEAGDILDNKLPLSMLRLVAINKQVPSENRNNIAWTAWVRAILINDEPAAKELALVAKSLNKGREKLFDSYLSAASPEERKFASAILMLKYSSAQPNPTWGRLMEDSYGDNSGWWWSAAPVAGTPSAGWDGTSIETIDPEFITAGEKSQAATQLLKLKKVETAPNYFAKIVLPFAKAHPSDSRVPEALHLLVKCTRYGSTDDASKKFSKEAFTILHSKYKGNPWTSKTPYFY